MDFIKALNLILQEQTNYWLIPKEHQQNDIIIRLMISRMPDKIQHFTNNIEYSKYLINISGNNLKYLSKEHRKELEDEAIYKYPNLYFGNEFENDPIFKLKCLDAALLKGIEKFSYEKIKDRSHIIYLSTRNKKIFSFFEKQLIFGKDIFFSKHEKKLREINLDVFIKFK